jgi:hypothetical protein
MNRLVPEAKTLIPENKVLVPDGKVTVPDDKVIVPESKVLVPNGMTAILQGMSGILYGKLAILCYSHPFSFVLQQLKDDSSPGSKSQTFLRFVFSYSMMVDGFFTSFRQELFLFHLITHHYFGS